MFCPVIVFTRHKFCIGDFYCLSCTAISYFEDFVSAIGTLLTFQTSSTIYLYSGLFQFVTPLMLNKFLALHLIISVNTFAYPPHQSQSNVLSCNCEFLPMTVNFCGQFCIGVFYRPPCTDFVSAISTLDVANFSYLVCDLNIDY